MRNDRQREATYPVALESQSLGARPFDRDTTNRHTEGGREVRPHLVTLPGDLGAIRDHGRINAHWP